MAEEKWDIVIKPKDNLFSVDFKELWAYRDLCSLFVKRNIITQYRQTILGPAWFVIQPALTVIMYMMFSEVLLEFLRMEFLGLCFIWQVLACGTISQNVLRKHPIRLSPIRVFLERSISLD